MNLMKDFKINGEKKLEKRMKELEPTGLKKLNKKLRKLFN